MLVDSAIYADGHPATPATLGEAYRASRQPGNFAWITLHEPTREECTFAAQELELDEMAAKDAIEPHQRPRLER